MASIYDNFFGSSYDNKESIGYHSEQPWWMYKVNIYNQNEYKYQEFCEALKSRAEFLIEEMSEFRTEGMKYTCFYEEAELSYRSRIGSLAKSWNLLRVAVDSHYNMIVKLNPRISFLPKDARSDIIVLAREVDDYFLNLYNESHIYRETRSAFKDSLICNLGILKIIVDKKNKTFKFIRVLPDAIGIEKPKEGSHFRTEICEKAVYKIYDIKDLIMSMNISEKYKKNKIRELEMAHADELGMTEGIVVYEMHKQGKMKVVFTEKMILSYTEWKKDFIPYLFFRWDKKQNGVIGTGPAELVTPAQTKINGLLYRIHKNTELFSNHYVILPQNSNLKELNNDFGNMYEINMGPDGKHKPIHVTPPIMNEQIFRHLEETYRKGLECARVSQLQGEGRMPIGMNQNSGKALKYYNDINTSRFVSSIFEYEDVFKDIAKVCLMWACDDFPSHKVFSEVKGLKDRFLKSVNNFTSNLLPETPAGRLDVLAQLLSMQVIQPNKAMELLDTPDITGTIRSETSRIRALEQVLEKAFYSKKDMPISPDPVLGYEEQREIALKIYSRIIVDFGADDPRLDKVRSFLGIIKEIIEKKKAEITRAISEGVEPGGNTPIPKPPPANVGQGEGAQTA